MVECFSYHAQGGTGTSPHCHKPKPKQVYGLAFGGLRIPTWPTKTQTAENCLDANDAAAEPWCPTWHSFCALHVLMRGALLHSRPCR